jgi:hypothetical protein
MEEEDEDELMQGTGPSLGCDASGGGRCVAAPKKNYNLFGAGQMGRVAG